MVYVFGPVVYSDDFDVFCIESTLLFENVTHIHYYLMRRTDPSHDEILRWIHERSNGLRSSRIIGGKDRLWTQDRRRRDMELRVPMASVSLELSVSRKSGIVYLDPIDGDNIYLGRLV